MLGWCAIFWGAGWNTRARAMQPTLWGPALWQVLFACAWTCAAADFESLRTLALDVLPLLLPCAKCRQHFVDNRSRVNRRARGEPRSADEMFRWLWFLKDEVNETVRREASRAPPRGGVQSVPLARVRERYALHGGLVDDVLLGDTLVLVAIEAHREKRDELFLQLCALLARLLPLPKDSELRCHLENTTRGPIVNAALRAARGARVERGLPQLTLAHYKAAGEAS